MNNVKTRSWTCAAGIVLVILIARFFFRDAPPERSPDLEPVVISGQTHPDLVMTSSIPAAHLLSRTGIIQKTETPAPSPSLFGDVLLTNVQPASPDEAPSSPPENYPYARPIMILSSVHAESATDDDPMTWTAPPSRKKTQASARSQLYAYVNFAAMLSASSDARPVALDSPALRQMAKSAQPKPGPVSGATNLTSGAESPELLARAMVMIFEGDRLFHEQNWTGAWIAYSNALSLFPRMTYANRQVGKMFLIQGEYARAITHLTQALDATEDAEGLLNDLGVAYLSIGRPNQAWQYFESAVAMNPDAIEPQFNAGLALREMDRIEEARKKFDAVLLAQPGHAAVYRERAVLDLLENDLDAAEHNLARAMALDPDWALPILDAAMLRANQRDFAEAIRLLDRALEIASARDVLRVYNQPPFQSLRLSPEGKPLETRIAAKARQEM